MTPPEVTTFMVALRDYVRRAIGMEAPLDGSEESLAYLDHYVTKTRAGKPISDEVLALVAPALGAYFGEVAIARFGGRWVIEGEDPSSWRVELEPGEVQAGLTFRPAGMAAEALRHDEVEGWDASLSTAPEMLGPLGEALAASPPVDEDYYYSLTGRLETIEQALDILAELARRTREKPDERS
jgi:hypothetical protein